MLVLGSFDLPTVNVMKPLLPYSRANFCIPRLILPNNYLTKEKSIITWGSCISWHCWLYCMVFFATVELDGCINCIEWDTIRVILQDFIPSRISTDVRSLFFLIYSYSVAAELGLSVPRWLLWDDCCSVVKGMSAMVLWISFTYCDHYCSIWLTSFDSSRRQNVLK